MLHRETVTAETLDLLREIQNNSLLKNTRLVGGTALALRYGHRKSIDLDFFGDIEASYEELADVLKSFGTVKTLKNSKTIKVFSCNNIKVDFVHYTYPWIDAAEDNEGIILAGDKDIAAMKIAAITGRGSKKDFYDLYQLLSVFSIDDILSFYENKYADGSIYLALKSLVYFEDADEEIEPDLLINVSWNMVKDRIKAEHLTYIDKLDEKY